MAGEAGEAGEGRREQARAGEGRRGRRGQGVGGVRSSRRPDQPIGSQAAARALLSRRRTKVHTTILPVDCCQPSARQTASLQLEARRAVANDRMTGVDVLCYAPPNVLLHVCSGYVCAICSGASCRQCTRSVIDLRVRRVRSRRSSSTIHTSCRHQGHNCGPFGTNVHKVTTV